MIALLTSIILLAGIHVHDGDTIGRGKDRIRIWGIDAPELSETGGKDSRDYLRSMISGKRLSCQLVERDRYGRRVMQCHLPNGTDLACQMVAARHAQD
jgi:micrococcal nuclease